MTQLDEKDTGTSLKDHQLAKSRSKLNNKINHDRNKL